MNGWEFVERLRVLDPTVPVMFVTGWGLREQEHARLTTLQVAHCLFKPLRGGELDAAIHNVLAR
jgi:DNA-binding response OmpR family regulator